MSENNPFDHPDYRPAPSCPRCGVALTPENIYIVGFCELCVHVIIAEWHARQDEPIDLVPVPILEAADL